MIKKYSRIKKLDKKYCSCIFKVRGKYLSQKDTIQNPYGICTNSVYLLKGLKRPKDIKCGKYIDFNKLTYKQLKSYLIEKKISTRNKGKYISKKNLLKKLKFL